MPGRSRSAASAFLVAVSAVLSALSGVMLVVGAPGATAPAHVVFLAGAGTRAESAPVVRFGATGVVTVANIPVGTHPEGLAYDPSSGEVFVANSGSNNVSVINDTSNKVVATIPVGTAPGSGPEGVAYDPATGDLFVPNYGSGNVSVLDGTSNTLRTTLSSGSWKTPVGVAFDSRTGLTYVTDLAADGVYPITPMGPAGVPTPVATPLGAAYDPATSELFVTDLYCSNVSVVNTTVGFVSTVIPVGPAPVPPCTGGVGPEGVAYDSGHGELFVVNYISNNITVINDTRNLTVANITPPMPPCYDPITPAYDARTGEVFVTCNSGGVVTVINDTNDTAYAIVPVGGGPYADLWDSGRGEIFVTNEFSNNVTVLSVAPAATYPVTFSETGLPTGTNWSVTFAGVTRSSTGGPIGFVAANGTYHFTVGIVSGFAATPSAGTVVVSGAKALVAIAWSKPLLLPLTFNEVGMGIAGLTWSVTVTTSIGVLAGSNTTFAPHPIVTAHGRIVFDVPNGTVTFTVSPPGGWGVARVGGSRVVSFTTVTVKGPTTVAVDFGPLRTVTFYEPVAVTSSGGLLPPGTLWGVTLLAGGKDDAPPPGPATARTTSLPFTLPSGGHYRYQVVKPSIYRAVPPHGTFTVPASGSGIPIRFYLIVERVVFVETNLTPGSRWGVNVTGTLNVSVNGTSASLAVALPNGTYSYTVWNVSARHPHPATGTITVVRAHGTVRIRVRYT